MKLNEFHVDQFCSREIRERVSVTGIFPTVAGDFVGAPDSAGREHNGLRAKNFESPVLAFVSKCTDDAITIFKEGENGVFHVNLDPLMHSVIL